MDFDRHRERINGIDFEYKRYFKNFDFISFMYWSMRRILKLIAQLFKFSTLLALFKIIPGISYALMYFDFMHDILINTVTSNRSLHTKIFKTAITIAASAMLALTFIFSSKLINITGSAINIVSNLWDCSTIIASKLFGKLKECRDINTQKKANLTLAESAHKIMLNTAFIVGAALMLNPASILAGAIILIAATCYTIIDRFKINPLRWLANRLFNFPFKKIKQNTTDKKKPFVNSNLTLLSELKTKRISKEPGKINTAHTFRISQPAIYKNDRFFASAIQLSPGEKLMPHRPTNEDWQGERFNL